MSARYHRRELLGAFGAVPLVAASNWCSPAWALDLASDDGSPIRNRAVDHHAVLASLGGAQRIGPADADVTVVEFFDYNCGYCRGAAPALAAILDQDPRVALVLAHCPILSGGSQDVADLQQAFYRRHGSRPAYELHLALLQARGYLDGGRARAIGDAGGWQALSADDVTAGARDVGALRRASATLGVRVTPTFVIGGTSFIGWPGPATVTGMIAAARACGLARCD
jgi:protein-disulfide isomerase